MAFKLRRSLAWMGCAAFAGGIGLAVAGYPQLAIRSAAPKEARISDSPQAAQAQQAFWEAFQAQRYDALPKVTEALTAAYLRHPEDPKLALLLAHAHFWRVAERSRDSRAGAGVTDGLVLANFYFAEAYRLQPEDHRISGWLASTELALGSVHADERTRRRGYFDLKASARAFPEFNNFSLGYVLSRLPAGDPRLDEAVEAMWLNLDLCVGQKVDRHRPDLSVLGATVVPDGPKRVCFNGAHTPHNVEGYFLAFGDLLVKTAKPAAAKAIYAQARISPTYDAWPFRALLEERIITADVRAAAFASGDAASAPETISTSAHACAICHAR